MIDGNIPPSETLLEDDNDAESHSVVKWIVVLLSIFQTRFFLTNRAVIWLINFIGVLLRFLGKYSREVASIAAKFPRSLSMFNNSLDGATQSEQFERRAACIKCDSIYRFKDCLRSFGSAITVRKCTHKPFKNSCNEYLMREVVSSSGN